MARPELDHPAVVRGHPMVLTVFDREENRRKDLADRGRIPSRARQPRGTPARVRSWAIGAKRKAQPKSATTRSKARALDQFYTIDGIAAGYLDQLRQRYNLPSFLLVEPSAGGGAFFRQMPENSVAFDVDPHSTGIFQADFLAIELRSSRRIITVGNPPFGNVACLAIAFFNHAARQSDVVALILPRSVLKASIENRLHRKFHCVHSEDVPPNSFVLSGVPRHVGAVFQIWERRAVDRELKAEDRCHPDFSFSTPELCDFVIRRVGANAGTIGHDRNVHAKSHYFIKGDVEAMMARLDLRGAARKATSTPSLAKSDIVRLYKRRLGGAPDGKEDQAT